MELNESQTFYVKYNPTKELSKYIKSICHFKSISDEKERILPIGTTELIFKLDRNHKVGQMFYSNLVTQTKTSTPKSIGEVIGLSFYPWGFNSLFGISQLRIINRRIELSDILQKSKVSELNKNLHGIDDVCEIINRVQEHLMSIKIKNPDLVVSEMVTYIDKLQGQVQMQKFYSYFNTSERRSQQVFVNSIGISPKHYALLKKFHSAVSRLETSPSLTELALDLNYYDQAHFIKDFKSFAGVCPTVIKKGKNILNKINELEYYNS